MGLLQKILARRPKPASSAHKSRTLNGAADSAASAIGTAGAHTNAIVTAEAHNAAGRHAEALAIIDVALSESPDNVTLLTVKGSTLYEWGRAREAREWFLRAEALGAQAPSLPLKLGWTCYVAGYRDEALAWMRKAVDADYQSAKAHFGLGIALQANNLPNDAMQSFEEAVARNPADFDSVIQLGNHKMDTGDLALAESLYRRAIAARPELALGWTNLGAVLSMQERLAEGLEAFERAGVLAADAHEGVNNFMNLAVAHSDNGRLEQSLAIYEKHLPREPIPGGHVAYAGALLRAGRMREGWSHYELRWMEEPYLSARPRYHKPVWNGQDLQGRTILLHSEQGIGDSIQFLRYAPQIKSLGATVILRVIPGLEDLARRFAGIDRVLDARESIPDFDFYVSLLSLPRVFGTELDSIPAEIPYLQADSERIARWVDRLGVDSRFKVGLVWAGNSRHTRDRYRSIRLGALAPLAALDGVRLVSMQKNPPAWMAADTPVARSLLDLAPELDDFDDTAALISALDLVIAVDTAVLHLAGALGKPVWGLLPEPPDFRWLESREDSPWYPTMRLFRQRRRDDWDEVIERVANALRETVAQRSTSATQYAGSESPRPALRSAPHTPNRGAAPGIEPGFFAAAETRVGLLQYRPHDSPIGKSIDWYGEYLQPHLDLLAQILRPGGTVVEVGADIGAHTVFLASLLGTTSHLMVYEEDPLLRRVLRQNLAADGASNVTIMRRALAGPREPDAVAIPVGSKLGKDQHVPEVRVTETLDELRLPNLQMLKVNDGTAGLDVLKGATETLWRLRPMLFIAAGDESTLAMLVNYAREYGYRSWKMVTPLFNEQNFNRRDNDIFAGRMALALLAIPEEIQIANAFPGCVELA